MAFVVGLGFNLAKVTAYTKVMNATSNLTAAERSHHRACYHHGRGMHSA
jgi:hypothetical protein